LPASIGDLTTNHTGGHVWFASAAADVAAPEAAWYRFRRHPDQYASWLDHPTLPEEADLNHEVARLLPATMREVNPDTWLLAEHGHDFSGDVLGDGWHGSMNYSGFTRPVWTWLTTPGHGLSTWACRSRCRPCPGRRSSAPSGTSSRRRRGGPGCTP
jgi:alpha-glucosidase